MRGSISISNDLLGRLYYSTWSGLGVVSGEEVTGADGEEGGEHEAHVLPGDDHQDGCLHKYLPNGVKHVSTVILYFSKLKAALQVDYTAEWWPEGPCFHPMGPIEQFDRWNKRLKRDKTHF